jgi:catechol 2,3-dioxygenase-like lactoylglutathione lyase family enzyme
MRMGFDMRIGSIVIHCHQFERTVTFWREALHYVPRAPARDGWVVLRDPAGCGPNLSFQARDTPPKARSWLHLDLYADNRDREVARLTSLGAQPYPWRYGPQADYVVLADPDGNLFCVVQVAGTDSA